MLCDCVRRAPFLSHVVLTYLRSRNLAVYVRGNYLQFDGFEPGVPHNGTFGPFNQKTTCARPVSEQFIYGWLERDEELLRSERIETTLALENHAKLIEKRRVDQCR